MVLGELRANQQPTVESYAVVSVLKGGVGHCGLLCYKGRLRGKFVPSSLFMRAGSSPPACVVAFPFPSFDTVMGLACLMEKPERNDGSHSHCCKEKGHGGKKYGGNATHIAS